MKCIPNMFTFAADNTWKHNQQPHNNVMIIIFTKFYLRVIIVHLLGLVMDLLWMLMENGGSSTTPGLMVRCLF